MKNKILTSNFIFNKINKNINKINNKCNTRFAPEASGYLHIGHTRNIIINYDISKIYNGLLKIRIDDTNPDKNKKKYIKYIKKNTKWIIKKINNNKLKKINYTSNYFHKLYQYLEYYKKNFLKKKKIKNIRKIKLGFLKEKIRTINFKKKNYKNILYRIKFKKHIKTIYNWFIYPLYDWGNALSDKIENINYSICSIEFSKNKKIYNIISKIIYKNKKIRQIEYSRLEIKNNITKKRIIFFLLKKKYIKNNKDSRLLTINSLKKSKINQIIIYSFLKELNLSRKLSIINNNIFKKKIISLINFNKNLYIINEYINIYIINLKKKIKFFIKNKYYFLSNNLLMKKNIFIKNSLKSIFFLKNFKKKIILINLKNIICKNYKKNKYGFIKYILCKFIKYNIRNNIKNSWINFKYKIKLLILKKKEIINKINNKINTKSFKNFTFFSENLIINNINNFYNFDKINICYNKFKKNKNNKIIFLNI
ncbi:Glutaminyl-tRNA synthetase [Candidatus Nasuia deltocephalinicola]|nr:Glutaminyl-tRNA synthetase [Candidatus Nasuia deltocephalinicola]